MNTQISVYDDDPTDANPLKKLVIKDPHMKMPDDVVLQFFRSSFTNHNFKSRVMKAKDKVSRYEYSKHLADDRLVYIQAPYPSSFSLNYAIDGFPCRFWHATQNTKCKRCNSTINSTIECLNCKLSIEKIRIFEQSETLLIHCHALIDIVTLLIWWRQPCMQ